MHGGLSENWLQVLFLGLVLLSAGCWGLVNSTIAGKRRKWYSGSLPNPLP